MKGLMMLLGKPKGKPGGEKEDYSEESTAKTYAKEAFAALKEDDEAGFVTAFLGAVRACKTGE